mmetsp:Transcript_41360/g.98074  ORF Transcript_41360/g.98074 Transcript_41360/m.98074 type:complete len:327 (+) Transcript_41360:906-1886(+)
MEVRASRLWLCGGLPPAHARHGRDPDLAVWRGRGRLPRAEPRLAGPVLGALCRPRDRRAVPQHHRRPHRGAGDDAGAPAGARVHRQGGRAGLRGRGHLRAVGGPPRVPRLWPLRPPEPAGGDAAAAAWVDPRPHQRAGHPGRPRLHAGVLAAGHRRPREAAAEGARELRPRVLPGGPPGVCGAAPHGVVRRHRLRLSADRDHERPHRRPLVDPPDLHPAEPHPGVPLAARGAAGRVLRDRRPRGRARDRLHVWVALRAHPGAPREVLSAGREGGRWRSAQSQAQSQRRGRRLTGTASWKQRAKGIAPLAGSPWPRAHGSAPGCSLI